jgi:hypothetical protein
MLLPFVLYLLKLFGKIAHNNNLNFEFWVVFWGQLAPAFAFWLWKLPQLLPCAFGCWLRGALLSDVRFFFYSPLIYRNCMEFSYLCMENSGPPISGAGNPPCGPTAEAN